jgi:flagellar motor switch protein FliG
MLARLSPEEAGTIRDAMRTLGPINADEKADVAAEFRRTRPKSGMGTAAGVELELSAPLPRNGYAEPAAATTNSDSSRFEFLANAPVSALVPHLAREHAQTIAVVLAHLVPDRAARVLASLPGKLQSETIERLSALGEADPESVIVLERELAAWMAKRAENRGSIARRRETVANILMAAGPETRRSILEELKTHNRNLAEQLEPPERALVNPEAMHPRDEKSRSSQASGNRYESRQALETCARIRNRDTPRESHVRRPQPAVASPVPQPRIDFDQIVHLQAHALKALLREVNPNVLVIALAGSRDELIDRICGQMPKRSARLFRRELRRLGPMRLSDVEAAQRVVANTAANYLALQRRPATARS